MKKALVILVLAFAAPLYASTITFVDTGGGVITWTSDVPCVAMGLDVNMSTGAITGVAVDSFFDIFMDAAFDEEQPGGDGYTYGEDPCSNGPVAKQTEAGATDLATDGAAFCISMGGLGGEFSKDQDPCTSGTIALTGSGAGTLGENALRGGCIDETGAKMDSNLDPTPLPFAIVENECVKGDAPFYNEWLGSDYAGTPLAKWASPDCWCYEWQCRGDTDGLKPGLYKVDTADLATFVSAFSKGDLKLDQVKICADLDHKKPGLYRVDTADLGFFVADFSKGDLKVEDCPLDWDGDLDDDYNFWIVP